MGNRHNKSFFGEATGIIFDSGQSSSPAVFLRFIKFLINFEGKKEIWVPKSAIRSNFDSKTTTSQKFEIDTWILKKNDLM